MLRTAKDNLTIQAQLKRAMPKRILIYEKWKRMLIEGAIYVSVIGKINTTKRR